MKSNLMEQPTFQRRFTSREGGLGASYNSLYPEQFCLKKGSLFEALIKLYQRQGNSLLKKMKRYKTLSLKYLNKIAISFSVIKRYCNKMTNHNYNKIVKSDWLSNALISALIGQFNRTARVMPK